jgi:hypothetical protein
MMATASRQACARHRTTALLPVAALAILLPLTGCSSGSSSGSAGASAPTATTSAAEAACTQVAAVLTDGPDPGADPVGYAEAQILQLRQIKTPDATIQQAIDNLANAYTGYSTADGKSKAATATANATIAKINGLCPDAGATL